MLAADGCVNFVSGRILSGFLGWAQAALIEARFPECVRSRQADRAGVCAQEVVWG